MRKKSLLKNSIAKRVFLISEIEDKMNILRMVNPVMPYPWGSKTFIQELLGNHKDLNKLQAELWMGAHPNASSQIQNGGVLADLNYIIAEDPSDFLGSIISRTYQDQLPFLLKVLAAEKPLSIQVHPNQKKAREGFTKENKLGISLDAPNRNYKDAFHKPELLVALTPFYALCGFREFMELTHLLKKYLPKVELPELTNFIETPDSNNFKALYSALLNISPEVKQNLLDSYLKQVHTAIPANPQEQLIKEWSFKLNEQYPNDIGVFSPLLMNIIVLKPMQGLYLESGILHSYLQGVGIEIMANSDNVLRGGLTPKHIDTAELLSVLDLTPHLIKSVKAVNVSPTEKFYPTPAAEFSLSRIKHVKNTMTIFEPSGSPEILFCYQGNFVVENCSQFLTLEQGQSLFVPYEVEGYVIEGKGTMFRAKVNL